MAMALAHANIHTARTACVVSTMVAAKAFFDYIYKKPGTVRIDNMAMWNIFHLYKLADRWDLFSFPF